jgi:hypothetical protein
LPYHLFYFFIDTGIAEEIIGHTVTDEFNKVLEVQQSKVYFFTHPHTHTHTSN